MRYVLSKEAVTARLRIETWVDGQRVAYELDVEDADVSELEAGGEVERRVLDQLRSYLARNGTHLTPFCRLRIERDALAGRPPRTIRLVTARVVLAHDVSDAKRR